MRSRRDIDERAESRFVSTGRLPARELVPALLSLAHELYGTNTEGANSEVYPALAGVPSELFGHLCGRDERQRLHSWRRRRRVHADERLEAVRLRSRLRGPRPRAGTGHTGRERNRLAVQLADCDRTKPRRPHQSDGQPGRDRHSEPGTRASLPMPSGGSSTTGCLASPAALCRSTPRCTPRLRRRTSEIRTSRACSRATAGSPAIRPTRPISTRGSAALNVSARDLAVMGATLADGGVNPVTRRASGRCPRRAGTRWP